MSACGARADVCYDLEYADVVLKASDGVEFATSRGLCGGSCSTLKTLFEVKPDQKVYDIPSVVSSQSLSVLLKWLHGPRGGVKMELTQEQAWPVLKAADYLGMQCWTDNCASLMKVESDWLTWVELANEFSSAHLLLAVLQRIQPYSQISAPEICCKLHSIKLMQVALQFFDKGYLTVVERFFLVIKEWGNMPDDLAGFCIVPPIFCWEYPCLADMVEKHEIVLEPVWVARLLEHASSYDRVCKFPICVDNTPVQDPPEATTITISTGFGHIRADLDANCEVLTVTQVDGRIIGGCVRVRCLPYPEQDGTGIDLSVRSASDLQIHPLTWVLPTQMDYKPIVVFSDVYGTDKKMSAFC